MPIQRRQLLQASVAALLLPRVAQAQFKVDVAGVGATQLPIGLGDFVGNCPQPLAAIINADLTRSGQFRVSPLAALSDQAQPQYPAWRSQNLVAAVGGSVSPAGAGRWLVRCRLWDAARQVDLGGQDLTVSTAELRMAAHRIADFVYQKLTGVRGVFATRIAYVSKSGPHSFALIVADSDGENARAALHSREPLMSPTWSPDGHSLAYVSFENGKPEVYTQNLATGARHVVGRFRGSNSAPAWSPDGHQLALVLTLTTHSRIYLMPSSGGLPRALPSDDGIDTEPVFTPDGHGLVFTSDRDGNPQIYQAGLDGSNWHRLTYGSDYAVSPALSPDGQTLAYIARRNGDYVLTLQDLSNSSAAPQQLGLGPEDGRPSFAPNGRMLLYSAVENGVEVLKTVSADGNVRSTLASAGHAVREPAWAPWTTPN